MPKVKKIPYVKGFRKPSKQQQIKAIGFRESGTFRHEKLYTFPTQSAPDIAERYIFSQLLIEIQLLSNLIHFEYLILSIYLWSPQEATLT